MLELRAQSFVLIDSLGEEKARLSCDEAGTVRLAPGRSGAALELAATSNGGIDVALRDAQHRDRLRFALRDEGSPVVTLLDAQGRLRCGVTLLADGAPALVFSTAEGELQMKLLIDRKVPRLRLVKEDEQQ